MLIEDPPQLLCPATVVCFGEFIDIVCGRACSRFVSRHGGRSLMVFELLRYVLIALLIVDVGEVFITLLRCMAVALCTRRAHNLLKK